MSGKSKLFAIVENLVQLYTSGNTFIRVLKDIQVTSVVPGRVKCELLVKEEHANELGTMQGGMATTAIDFLTSLAVLTIPAGEHTVSQGVSVNLNVDFLSPIHVGQTAVIDSYCIKSGKRIAFVYCDFYDKATGRHCIRGKHTHYAIVKADNYKDFKPEDFQ